jgi:hypothetical protein
VSDDSTKTPLLVNKTDSKKGSLWHDFADKRFKKQHGGYDIPEGDLHAVHKYVGPVLGPQATSEETNAALSNLERELQQLKTKNQQSFQPPSKPPEDFEEFFEEKKSPDK